jgi:ABC-type glycerol-3-phosphate transport system substrate-binding protein
MSMFRTLHLPRRKRTLGVAVAALALAGLVLASASTAAHRATVTITFQEQFGDAESAKMVALVKKFEAANPTIHVNLVRDNDSSYYDKLVTQIIGGAGPDIARVEPPKAVQYITAQYAAPIDKWFPKSYRKQFFPSTIGPLTRGGKLYGLPQDVATLVLFYRTDLFKAAGIKHAPATWDELVADAKMLSSGSDRYGIGLFGGWGAFEFYPWLWSAGGQVLKPSGGKLVAALNDAPAVQALQLWTDLEKQKLMPPGAANLTEDDVKGPFIAGKLAMFTSGPWSVASLKSAGIDGKWSVAPLPKGKTRASVLGGMNVIVLNNSKHKAEAAKFLAWLYQDKVQSDWDRSLGFIPVKKTLYNTPAFKRDPLSKQFYASLQISRSRPVVPQAGVIDNALGQAVQAALSGAQTPQAALDAAAKTANDALSG